MRTIETTFNTFGASVLLIGLKGDSNATEILIDCAESLEEYQGTMAAMSITGPDETVYPGDISLDENGIVHWVVAARDCGIAGHGSARVDLVDDLGTVVASAEARTIIIKTNMQGIAPDQIANWTEAASVALQEVRAALLDLIDNDESAIANEAARQLAETGRVSAETLRISAETARASAETARATAETARASAETARATAETARASAETGRATAETARVNEFSTIKANAQAALSYIGPSEASSTATAAHAEGSYFIYNGKLYQATADIDIGDTITSGTNCAQVPGGAMGEVSNLKSKADNLENTIYEYKTGITWSLGVINTETGDTASSQTRIITDGFTFAPKGSSITVDSSDYKIALAKYSFPTKSGFDEYINFATVAGSYIIDEDCYIIAQAAYTNDATISTVADVSDHVLLNIIEDSVRIKTDSNTEDIAYIQNNVIGIKPTPTWIMGALNSANGSISTSGVTNRIATETYIRATPGSKIGLKDYTNYKISMAIYSVLDKTFLTYISFASFVSEYTIEQDCYVRLSMAYKNDYSMSLDYLTEYLRNLDMTVVAADSIVNRLNNTEDTVGDLVEQVEGETTESAITSADWFVRGISSDDRKLYNANNRITNKWFIHALAGSTLALDNYTNYGLGIAYYKKPDFDLPKSNSYYHGFSVNKSTVKITEDTYIMICMRYEDNRVIQNANDLASHLVMNIITDSHESGSFENVQDIKTMLKSGLSLTHRDYHGKKQYRIHVDEVIWALWDLATNNYESIFDQWEFSEYKRIHDAYGTVFVLSLHYIQLDNIAWNAPIPSGMKNWSLEDMPNTWRNEFIANSDWIKFSFHAYAYEYRYDNPPSSPYIREDWEQDIIDMREQVVRFAGEETWVDEIAKTHGVLGDQKLIRIFMNQGAKWFEADSEHVERTDPGMQSYYLTDEQQNKMFANGTYYDPTNKALFIASAGNLERLYGFVGGNIELDDYLDAYVYNSTGNYPYRIKCDYMTFCSHESPMMNGMVVILNSVTTGDFITLNGVTYTAGTDFAVGASNDDTATNFYNALGPEVKKWMRANNRCTIYATLGSKSSSFEIRTPMQQIEKTAAWCAANGWEGHHFEEESFYNW